jgi:hypothetical protein
MMATKVIPVWLTQSQMEYARDVGCKRDRRCREQGLNEKHPHDQCTFERDTLRDHITGARGELAVAEVLGLHWSGFVPQYNGRNRMPDIGKFIEVRTARKESGELAVKPRDPDEWAMVFVTGIGPGFNIRGWTWAYAAKQREFWKDKTGRNRWAYFVSVDFLEEFETLRALIKSGFRG